MPSHLQHYIVVMQLPIVSLLIIFSYQAKKAFAERSFEFVALGWLANLGYLVFGHAAAHADDPIFSKLYEVLPAAEIARTCNVLTLGFFFFAAHHFFRDHRPELILARIRPAYLSLALLPVLALELLRSATHSAASAILHVPAVILTTGAVAALAVIYYDTLRLREDARRSTSRILIVFATAGYALIQPLSLAPGRWPEPVGFTSGFLFKTIMVIGLVGGFVMSAESAARSDNVRRRLGEVARTVGRITHELGTPIRLLDNQVTSLRKVAPTHGEFSTQLAALENTVLRIDSVIDATLALLPTPDSLVDVGLLASDPQLALPDRRLENTNINTLVQLALMAVKETRGERVYVRTSYAGHCCIECVPFEIVQIFINLLRNAYDAMPRGTPGHVYISTKSIAHTQVQVCVTDDGHGISPDLRTTIFDDGVTTRSGRGRGYGMGVVRQLTENHMGTIAIDSPTSNSSGRPGTTVTLTFPRVPCITKEERLGAGNVSATTRNRR